MKAMARIGLLALVLLPARSGQLNAPSMLCSLMSVSRNCVLIHRKTFHACVWRTPRPIMLPCCVHISTAAQHLSMLQVACTALGVNHCLLKGRTFDMCIVDEAGQMTLPVALGPILHSKYDAVSSCLFQITKFTCTETPNMYAFVWLFVVSFIYSLVHLFYSFIHSFILSPIRSIIPSLIRCTIVFPYHQVYTVLRGSQHEVLQSVNQQGHLTCLFHSLAWYTHACALWLLKLVTHISNQKAPMQL